MFGSNAFGALADEQQSNADAGPSLSQVDGEETDADWLQLSKTNGEVYVRVSDKVELDGLPQECNLMAVSNTYGLVAVGGQSDVRIHRLDEIHRLLEDSAKDVLPVSSPVAVLALPGRPVWVRLAMSEERLVVALADGAGICLYKLGDVVNGNTSPYSTVTSDIPPHLLDVLPNPAPPSSSDALSRKTALITDDGFVMLDLETGELAGQTAGSFTCGCWSAKGKQIVIGTKSGVLEQYTPDGTPKSRIPAPPELDDSAYYPTFVRWLENDLFLACYARIEAEDPRDPLEVIIIQRTKQSITYTKYFDINDSMGVEDRLGNHRFYVDLKQWGPTSRHLGFMASGIGTEIGVLHGAAEDAGSAWQAVFLGEMARGVLPGAKKGVSDEDTSVLAMEVDLTATKPVVRGMEGGVDLPDLPPPPRLLVYSQAGLLISFDVRYPDVGPYPGMIVPQDIVSPAPAGDNNDMDLGTGANTPAVTEEIRPPAASSAFGASSTPSKPTFGASAFGSSSTPTPFGQSSGFGSTAFGSTTPSSLPAPKPAFGQSTFGSTVSSTTPAPKPTFGQSSFGSTTPASTPPPKPAFGQSAFGQSAFGSTTPFSTPASKPAFGQSTFGSTTPATKPTFGQSPFGSTTPSSTPESKPAFGQSAFGAVASGSTTPAAKPTFGQTSIPAFGQSSTPAASPFGQTAFGQSSKPAFGSSSFGQSSAPAFGQSGFGAAASPSSSTVKPTGGFGSSAFGQSAFGQSTFGQSAKPSQSSAFGQAAEKPESAAKSSFSFAGKADSSGSSAFGSSAVGSGSTSPFAKKDPPKDAPTFGSSPNPFAQPASTSNPFGSGGSAFGGTAFGKPGASAFDTKPAFGKTSSQTTPSPSADSQTTTGLFGSTKPAAAVAKSPDDDFGLGGFASALGASSTLTPPAATQSAMPSGKARVPGLEDCDEEDDNASFKSKPSTSSASTSAFIKPATGFAQASSGGFGTFGHTAGAPKTAPSGTPAAFSAPPPTTSAFGKPASSSGGVAFGQSSKPGGVVAFGQSSVPTSAGAAFGKPSAPAAFGRSANPSASGFGNISGGFGGFGKSSSGGFGGFASSSSGESIFAKKDDKALGPATPAFGAKPTSTVPVFGQNKPAFGIPAKPSSPQPASTTPKAEPTKPEAKGSGSPSPLSSPALSASSVEEDDVEPETAVMPAGYASMPPPPPKSPVATKAPEPELAVIPPGYDVPGAVSSPTESAEDDVPPASVEAASAVPLPPTESPAPIRLPPVETIVALPSPVDEGDLGPDIGPGDVSPTKSLDEGVFVEYDEAPTAVAALDGASAYGSDKDYDDEYDYEEEVEGEGEEYDTEEDKDDDEEETDEDLTVSRRRRSISLAPPEMSPIAEEPGDLDDEGEDERSVDDDEESVDDEQSEDGQGPSEGEVEDDAELPKAPLKSPPAWFSSTAPSGPSLPASSEGSAPGSLSGRLDPVSTSGSSQATPAAPKLPPAFSLKHAVKTSSPLGQPPQTADRSPPGTPAKPATSAFSAFGNASSNGQSAFGANKSVFGQGLGLGKPPAQPAKSPSEETKPVFGEFGLGQTASATAPETKPVFGGFGLGTAPTPADETKPVFSGFGLGNTTGQPTPPSTSDAKLTFGGFGSTATTQRPAEDAKPAFGGFRGFGQTSSAPAATTPAPGGFAGFGQSKPAQPAASPSASSSSVPPAVPASVPAPPVVPAVPPTDFSIPPRQPVPAVREIPSDGKRTMTAVLERLIASLLEDVQQLRATLAQNERYHQAFSVSNFPKISADNLSKHTTLPFSSLDQFREIVDVLSAEVAQIVSDQAGVDAKLSDVQSKLLKSDMKVGQAEKFIKARQDPSFASVMQIKELSIDQAESQARLRVLVQTTEDRLSELEAGIANLKKRVEHQHEAHSNDSDALDRVQKSVRDMDISIRDHAETIDELADRISSIRVGTPSRRRESTPAAPVRDMKTDATPPISFQPSSAVRKAVQDSLARQSKLRARLVARAGETARLTTLDPKEGGKGVLSHVSLVDGPISVDATPLPGTVDVKPDESGAKSASFLSATKESPLSNISAPGTNAAAPSSIFGNITFGKLDPGTITRASAAERKSATSGGSSRGHQSAPKFGGGLAAAGGAKTSDSPSLSFVPPPPATGNKAAPSGFFSLSSFGK